MTHTILITGGAGFIGSHVADRFIENGNRVLIVDNLSSGKQGNINPKAIFYKLDITDHQGLEQIFEKEKPDFVLHFSAQISATFSLKNPRNDARQNILDLINVLDCAHRFGVKKIFFASSAAVYGNNPELPLQESELKAPVNFYGLTKSFGEEYIKMYQQIHGLSYLIGRFSNVYGERQNTVGESGVIALFTYAAAHGKSIIIEGDGEQTRDFLYVGDLADLIFSTFQTAENEVLNYSTGESVSIKNVVDMLKISAPSLEVTHAPARHADIRNSCLANERLKKYSNHQFVPIAEGLKRTLDWYGNR